MSKEVIETPDGYKVEKTSYRTFTILSPEGNEYIVWADPYRSLLKCNCPWGSRYARHRACKHIKMVKEYFDT